MRLIFLPFEESSYMTFARSASGLYLFFYENFISGMPMCISILQSTMIWCTIIRIYLVVVVYMLTCLSDVIKCVWGGGVFPYIKLNWIRQKKLKMSAHPNNASAFGMPRAISVAGNRTP